jgi:hypothetical protein
MSSKGTETYSKTVCLRKLSQMDNNESIKCWNVEAFISIFGIIALIFVLIILPIQLGVNLLGIEYWISLLEYGGPFAFIFYVGFWGILVYYAWFLYSSFAGTVINRQRIQLFKLFFLAREISWTEVRELYVERTNDKFSEMIITTVQGESLKFRFNTDMKDPTDQILRIRDLSMINK